MTSLTPGQVVLAIIAVWLILGVGSALILNRNPRGERK